MPPLERVIPKGTPSKQINCSLLIEPWHVFAQLAEAFLGVTSRLDSLQVNSPSSFVELVRTAHRAGRMAQGPPLLVLWDAEALLQDGPMVLWTLLQLPLLLVCHTSGLVISFPSLMLLSPLSSAECTTLAHSSDQLGGYC